MTGEEVSHGWTIPLKILGWTMAGLSMLTIAAENTFLTFYGAIADAIGAYDSAVRAATSALFGWIDFRWMDVSHLEGHLLIILTALSATLAFTMRDRSKPEYAQRLGLQAAVNFFWSMGLGLSFSILLPFFVDIAVLSFWLFILAIGTFGTAEDGPGAQGRTPSRALIGVIAGFAILIAVNYSGLAP